jgi:hypothetical protein
MKDSIEKVNVVVTGETMKAYEFRDGDNPDRIAWFPKSEVSFSRRNINTGVAVAEIPMWLLKAKGWDS